MRRARLTLLVTLAAGRAAQASPPLRVSAEAGLSEPLVGARAQRFGSLAVDVPLLPHALELALGARLTTGALTPDPAPSALLRLSLCAWQPPYNPALGLELELGPGTRSHASSPVPDSLERAFNAGSRDDPLWASVVVEPLRFEHGAFLASLAGLRLGTPVSDDSGRRVQLGISLIRLGYRVLP